MQLFFHSFGSKSVTQRRATSREVVLTGLPEEQGEELGIGMGRDAPLGVFAGGAEWQVVVPATTP